MDERLRQSLPDMEDMKKLLSEENWKIGNGKGDIPTLKHRKERRSINPTIIIWYNRTLHVLPITLCFLSKTHKKTPKFYPKRTKTDHRTAWKAFKTAQKYRNWLKLDKIFLSHYQVVEVLEQKKDFKIFGQNWKRQYFCNPKRRGKQGARMRGSRRGI